GKCPACGSWMYVPCTPLPTVAAARAEPAAPATGRKEVDAVSLAEVELPPEKPARAEPRPASKAEEIAEARLHEEASPEAPTRQLSRFAAVLVLLALLALGAVATSPFIPPSAYRLTGELLPAMTGVAKPHGVSDELMIYVVSVPAGVAGVVLLSLLVALVSG